MISTFIFGSLSLACTVTRAGVWPATSQASHTAFMAAKSAMSLSQITADRIFVLSLPPRASSAPISASACFNIERSVLGDHAREIHAIAIHAGLAQPRAGIDAADVAHVVSSHGLCGTHFRFAGRLWQELLAPTARGSR